MMTLAFGLLLLILQADSAVTQQSLAKSDSKDAVIIGLAVAVAILGIVAITTTAGILVLWKSRKANHSTTRSGYENDRALDDNRRPAHTSELATSDVVGYEDLTSVRPGERMYSSITNEYENTNLSLY